MLRHIKNKRISSLFIYLLFSVTIPTTASAQLIDIISEYLVDKIEEKINGYITSSASNLWDNFVDYSARNSLAEKSKELSNFTTNTRRLSDYDSNSMFIVYGGNLSTDKTLDRMKNNINSQFNSHLLSAANIPFSNMGNGILSAKCDDYLNDVEESGKIKTLKEVLNSTIINSITQLPNTSVADRLLDDVNNHPGLIPILNNTPGAIDFYCKLINSVARVNPSELLYWAAQADAYRSDMPKKTKLINPRSLIFDVLPNGNIVIKDGKNELATYSPADKLYNVSSLEFLNFLPRPDHQYNFEKTTFSTDELGRIRTLTFISDKNKNKTKQKNQVKYNDIAKALTGESKNNLYTSLLKKYNVPPAAAFAVTVNTDKAFKQSLKSFEKTYKAKLKSGDVRTLTVRNRYSGTSDTPVGIVLCPNLNPSGFTIR